LRRSRLRARAWAAKVAAEAPYLGLGIRDHDPLVLNFLTEVLTELLIKRAVRRGDVAIDAGANHGFHTRHLLRAVGRSGHVHAFEPNPELAARLRSWNDRRLSVHEVALGDAPGRAILHVPDDDDGWGSLYSDHLTGRSVAEFQVEIVRIDDSLSPHEAVRFAKLDVERSELAALRGMSRTLQSSRPLVVFEEPYDNLAWKALAEVDYDVMDLVGRPLDSDDHRLVNLLGVPSELSDTWCFWPRRRELRELTLRHEALRQSVVDEP
jgi:FkbM family methyltransferase